MKTVQLGYGNNFGLVGKTVRRYMATTALTAAGLMAIASPAAADNWTDHVASEGSISIDTSIPNTTNITQSTDFVKVSGDGDINAGWTVNVAQPSSSSKYVLYDIENDPTEIMGALNANGQIYIFDQNGVIFGEGSQVNVGSIVASSATVKSEDIKSGKIPFKNVGAGGNIALKGTINVGDAGLAAFVAPGVSNSGVINAKMGNVVMASGEKVTLDMYGDGLVNVAVDGALENALIENKGSIKAEGGNVVITASAAKDVVDNVINMDGVVDVSSVSVQGGKIVLNGGGKGVVKVAGTLNADGKNGGGSIDVKGETVVATSTSVISADASGNGNGGTVNLLASKHADFSGALYARGGELGGNGGKVEISGKETVGYDGYTDLSAVRGLMGDMLIDPNFVIIYSGLINKPFGLNYVLSAQALANSMRNTSITVQADNFIDVGLRVGPYSTGNVVVDALLNGLVGSGNIDLSTWTNISLLPPFFTTGTTAGGITFDTNTLNINKNLKMGNGNVTVQANTVNLNGIVQDKNGAVLQDARISSNAGTVNVKSPNAKINQAIWLSNNTGGGTINVAAGTYNESVNVDRQVSLFGANKNVAADGVRGAESKIDPNSPGFYVTADGAVINGFEITSADDGVLVDGADNVTVSNNYIHDIDGSGVVFSNALNGTASQNLIRNTGLNGVRTSFADGTDIVNNKIGVGGLSGNINGDGIFGFESSGLTVSGNEITNTKSTATDIGSGVQLIFSENSTVSGNKIYNTGWDGVRVGQGSHNVDVLSNDIDNVFRTGVYLGFVNDSLVEGNSVNGTTTHYGVHVDGGNKNTVNKNDISNSKLDGVFAQGASALVVSSNTVNKTGRDGIRVDHADGARLLGNIIGKDGGPLNINGDGIYGFESAGLTVSGNEITNTKSTATDIGSGVQLIFSENSTVSGNTIYNTGWDGVRVGQGSHNVDVLANDIDKVFRTGVYLGFVNDSLVEGNSVNGTSTHYGVHVDGGNKNTVNNNEIDNTNLDGIFAQGASNLLITANTVDSTGRDGIRTDHSDGAQVLNNFIGLSGGANNINGDGIYGYETASMLVSGNQITNTKSTATNIGSGVHLIFSENSTVSGNKIYNTGWDGVRAGEGSHNVKVLNNNIANVFRTGVYLHYLNTALVDNNIIDGTDTHYGVHVAGGGTATVSNNNIDNTNLDGIFAEGAFKLVVNQNDVSDTGRDGIRIETSNGAVVSSNTIGVDGGAFNVNGDGILVFKSNNGVVKGNTITKTKSTATDIGSGVQLLFSENGVVGGAGADRNTIYNTGWDGVRIGEGSHNATVNNNDIKNVGRTGIYLDNIIVGNVLNNLIDGTVRFGVNIDGGNTILVDNNDIDNTGLDGVIGTKVTALKVSNNRIGQKEGSTIGKNGIAVIDSPAAQILSNTVSNTAENGIFVDPSPATIVADNIINDTGLDGIRIEYSDNSQVLRNQIGTLGGDNNINGDGIFGYESAGLKVFGNTITNTTRTADNIGSGVQLIYSENSVVGGTGDGESNKIYNTAWDGVRVGEGSHNVKVINNDIDTVGRTGVYLHYLNVALVQGNQINGTGTHYGVHAAGGGNIEVSGNDIDNTHLDGVFSEGTFNLTVDDNNIGLGEDSTIGVDGVHVTDGRGSIRITNNDISNANDDGAEVIDSAAYVYIAGNVIKNSGFGLQANDDAFGGDGIHVRNVTPGYTDGDEEYNIVIYLNNVSDSADDGIEVIGSEEYYVDIPVLTFAKFFYPEETGRVLIKSNTVFNSGFGSGGNFGGQDGTGGDGIYVTGIYADEYGSINVGESSDGNYAGYAVDILGNNVTNSGDDGIEVVDGSSVLIDGNTVQTSGFTGDSEGGDTFARLATDGYGADGIHVRNVGYYNGLIEEEGGDEEVPSEAGRFAALALPGFGVTPYSVVIVNNTVDNSQDDGIQVESFTKGGQDFAPVLVENNLQVSNSGTHGLYISGPSHSNVIVRGNGFSNFDIGAEFESGLIDLTGVGNTFDNGRIGLRFAPYQFDGEGPSFANLNLVDDDDAGSTPFPATPTNFGGTIGAQTFTGFGDDGDFYVFLADGAFTNEGTPIWINGLNSSYDGITPTLTGGLLSQSDYDYLEARFQHFPDNATTDIFWFGFVPEDTALIDQSLIFNRFAAFNGDITGLNVRILGLPSIPGGGTAANLNNITTFAGGGASGGNTPGDLNSIETAAGGDETGIPQSLNNLETAAGGDQRCWSNAANIAGGGQAVNVVYNGSFTDNLDQAEACGGSF